MVHLLVVNNVVNVNFHLSGKNILNFPSDDEIVISHKEVQKLWIEMSQAKFSDIYSGPT